MVHFTGVVLLLIVHCGIGARLAVIRREKLQCLSDHRYKASITSPEATQLNTTVLLRLVASGDVIKAYVMLPSS